MSLIGFVFRFYIQERPCSILVFVFLWLILLSTMPRGSICVVANGKVQPLSGEWYSSVDTCTTSSLFTCPSVDIQVVSTSCILEIMLQWTWRCRYLSELVCAFSLNKYSEVELLDPMLAPLWIFQAPPYCFPEWLCQFTPPPAVHKSVFYSTSSPILVSYLFDSSCFNWC